MKDYVFSHDIRKQTPFLSRAALQVGRDTHMPMNYTSSVFSNNCTSSVFSNKHA